MNRRLTTERIHRADTQDPDSILEHIEEDDDDTQPEVDVNLDDL